VIFNSGNHPVGMTLADVKLGDRVTVTTVTGERTFRRRLMEMGLVPGTEVRVIAVAPLGDPVQIEVRGGQWSVRRREAANVAVKR